MRPTMWRNSPQHRSSRTSGSTNYSVRPRRLRAAQRQRTLQHKAARAVSTRWSNASPILKSAKRRSVWHVKASHSDERSYSDQGQSSRKSARGPAKGRQSRLRQRRKRDAEWQGTNAGAGALAALLAHGARWHHYGQGPDGGLAVTASNRL